MRPEEKIEKRFVSECAAIGIQSMKLERKGKKGFPDQCVFLPNAYLLLIEFKRPGGTTSYHQDICHQELRDKGFEVMVCDQWEYPLKRVKVLLNERK